MKNRENNTFNGSDTPVLTPDDLCDIIDKSYKENTFKIAVRKKGSQKIQCLIESDKREGIKITEGNLDKTNVDISFYQNGFRTVIDTIFAEYIKLYDKTYGLDPKSRFHK